MARKSAIGFDIEAINRAYELRAEALVLRRQTRALIRRARDKTSVIDGISAPMLLEIAYDLTALGMHDLSRRCRAMADELGRKADLGFIAPAAASTRMRGLSC